MACGRVIAFVPACRAELQPKVDHIRAVATVGVHLRPLVNEVPAFGAAIITLIKPPKLSYNIDIGAVGGKVAGGGVEQFLDNLIPGIIEGFLVWPERIVVPILGEDVTGPLTDLMLRHKGIMKACLTCAAAAAFTCTRLGPNRLCKPPVPVPASERDAIMRA